VSAVVIDVDCDRAAQLRPGDVVRFGNVGRDGTGRTERGDDAASAAGG
jgi:allophanate hydrolase subunit 2